MLFGAIRLLVSSIIVRRKLRCAEPITSGPVRQTLDRLLRRRGVRHSVRLLASAAAEPAALGIRRWAILVPRDLSQRLTREEIEALLAHELAHLVRRDPVWMGILRVLNLLMPWQPLHRVLRHRWIETAEQLCDDWTLASGVPALTLARCLTRVAEWKLSPPVTGLTAVGSGAGKLTRRVLRLTEQSERPKQGGRFRSRGMLATGAAIATVALTCCAPRIDATQDVVPGETSPGPTSAEEADPVEAVPTPSTLSANEAERPDDTQPSASAAEAIPIGAEFRVLLTDLREVERLLGVIGDDEELAAVRGSLRSRLDLLEQRLSTIHVESEADFDRATESPGPSASPSPDPVLETGQ